MLLMFYISKFYLGLASPGLRVRSPAPHPYWLCMFCFVIAFSFFSPQDGSLQINLKKERKKDSYFIPKKITTSKFVCPRKSLLFLAYPKKSLSPFFTNPKNLLFFFHNPKISLCGQNFRPRKTLGPPTPLSLKYVSGALGSLLIQSIPLDRLTTDFYLVNLIHFPFPMGRRINGVQLYNCLALQKTIYWYNFSLVTVESYSFFVLSVVSLMLASSSLPSQVSLWLWHFF